MADDVRDVESRLAELFPSADALIALGQEHGLPTRGLSRDLTPRQAADALLALADRHGRLKTLLRECLRRHPNDPTLRDALRRDPRFAGETGPAFDDRRVGAAASLSIALAGWGVTHVWSLDDTSRAFAALLAGGLGDVQRLDTPPSPSHALSSLKALGAGGGGARVVMVASEPFAVEVGRALIERAQTLPVALRLVEAEPAPGSRGRASRPEL